MYTFLAILYTLVGRSLYPFCLLFIKIYVLFLSLEKTFHSLKQNNFNYNWSSLTPIKACLSRLLILGIGAITSVFLKW